MQLYLLRHTKTAVAQGICYGHSDVEMLPTNQKQLNNIYNSVLSIQPEVIFTSPLRRCETLAHKINAHDSRIIKDERLKELNFGKWEGLPWDTIEKSEEASNWFGDYMYIKCPDGESYHDLLLRVKDFLNYLEIFFKNKNILLVTHAGVIRAIHSIAGKFKPEVAFGLNIDFGEIMYVDYPER